ncbi:MAG: NADH-quinone oxidoreductase subunit L [Actinomycetaceae bacterium]|nr:NADH-quinone oxidoreductase subunit L [Actinomycetaceae bacterium]
MTMFSELMLIPGEHGGEAGDVGAQIHELTAATGASSWAWLMIAIPLLSSGLLLLLGRKSDKWGHILATCASWASFVVGVFVLFQLINLPDGEYGYRAQLYEWVSGSGFNLSLGLQLDQLSLTFVMLVTFVGSLIHVYSIGYMEHDSDRRRFFAYLNLFVAAMLTLVLADSYILLFFGWEGVGLASYLLIGFWNQELPNAIAAKKAFVMNRVGDMGLLLAMMTMFMVIPGGDLSYENVLGTIHTDPGTVTKGALIAIGLFLLLGACGKSAQFPLQAWLGDAMAGPTPVSALIHAATMVTAGVYLMVRSGVIYTAAPAAQMAVAIIGAITLMFGAIVGCAKDDMKKVLAASTMSQIGYMMLGAGLGPVGWTLAIFHLVSHGFFKAQMFLCAGNVMHAMSDQVNIRRFGNLRTVMKITWITFGIGWLAILGIPPFSGFFSKEPIIAAAFNPDVFGVGGAWALGMAAMIGAGITSFYMSRLFFAIFHGQQRWTTKEEGVEVHPHEANAYMTVPVIILSIFSIGFGAALGATHIFEHWLAPVTGHVPHGETVLSHTAISVITMALVIVGLVAAFMMFAKKEMARTPQPLGPLVEAARNDLYQDQINETSFVKPVELVATGVGISDRGVWDGIIRGLAGLAMRIGRVLQPIQNGYIRAYASYITVGVVFALVAVLWTRF